MISGLERNEPFLLKAAYLLGVFFYGATSEQFQETRSFILAPHRSPCAYPNPYGENLVGGLFTSLSTKPWDLDSMIQLPWGNRFSKGQYLRTYGAYSDQHSLPLVPHLLVPKLGRRFIDNVVKNADDLGRQITLIEQYQLALDLADGHPLGAALVAHSGARAIARNRDQRVDNELYRFSQEEMNHWRDCVSFFISNSDSYGEVAGDTYHFWGAFVAGMVVDRQFRARDIIFNPIYKGIYPNMEWIAALATGLTVGDWVLVHKVVDREGFSAGKSLSKRLIV